MPTALCLHDGTTVVHRDDRPLIALRSHPISTNIIADVTKKAARKASLAPPWLWTTAQLGKKVAV
jgi:hypothetical protein